MITKKGSILSSISSLANFKFDKNYILIKNIFEEPIVKILKHISNTFTFNLSFTNYKNCIET